MAELTRNDHAVRDNFTLPYGHAECIGSREQLCATQNPARLLGLVMVTSCMREHNSLQGMFFIVAVAVKSIWRVNAWSPTA